MEDFGSESVTWIAAGSVGYLPSALLLAAFDEPHPSVGLLSGLDISLYSEWFLVRKWKSRLVMFPQYFNDCKQHCLQNTMLQLCLSLSMNSPFLA